MKDNCIDLYKQGKFIEAENCFKKTLEQNPKDLFSLINLGNCYYRQNKFEDGLSLFVDALKLQNEDDYVLNMAGLCCYNLGNFKSSLDYFLRSIKTIPDSDYTLYWLGLINFRLGDYNSALGYFDNAIEINPENSSYLGLKGECLLHLEKFSEALDYFDKADPDLIDEYYQNLRCIIFFKQNNFELVLKTMKTFEVDLTDDHSLFAVFLKNLLEQSKKTLEIYKTIFTLLPENIFKNEIILNYSKSTFMTNPNFCKTQLLKSEAIDKFHQNNLSSALTSLKDLHVVEDNDSISWYWEGLIHFKLNDFSNSLSCFKKSFELDSGNQYYQFWLGMANYYTENYSDAKSNFQKCLDFKNDSEFFYWKGQSHEKLGEYENATQCFKMALDNSIFLA